jgi:hypothetical protein
VATSMWVDVGGLRNCNSQRKEKESDKRDVESLVNIVTLRQCHRNIPIPTPVATAVTWPRVRNGFLLLRCVAGRGGGMS